MDLTIILFLLGVGGWVAFIAVLYYFYGYIGKDPLVVARALGDCRRGKIPCGLIKVGRAIRVIPLKLITEDMGFFRAAGIRGLVNLSHGSVYRMGGSDVVIATVSSPRSLAPEELEALGEASIMEGEAVRAFRENVRLVKPRIEAELRKVRAERQSVESSGSGDEKTIERLLLRERQFEEIKRELELAEASRSLAEVKEHLERLGKLGLEFREILPPAMAVNLDLLDRIAERAALGATSTLVTAAAQLKGIEQVVERFEKAGKKSNWALILLIGLILVGGLIVMMAFKPGG